MHNTPAQALTMKECSAKFKAAKADGTLNGEKWNDFRKAQCGAEAAAEPAPAPAAAKPAKPAPAAAGNAVFPSAVDTKFSSEKPGRARLHTCSEQWQANKASNGNGNMRWSHYYSECNKRLKGTA